MYLTEVKVIGITEDCMVSAIVIYAPQAFVFTQLSFYVR